MYKAERSGVIENGVRLRFSFVGQLEGLMGHRSRDFEPNCFVTTPNCTSYIEQVCFQGVVFDLFNCLPLPTFAFGPLITVDVQVVILPVSIIHFQSDIAGICFSLVSQVSFDVFAYLCSANTNRDVV